MKNYIQHRVRKLLDDFVISKEVSKPKIEHKALKLKFFHKNIKYFTLLKFIYKDKTVHAKQFEIFGVRKEIVQDCAKNVEV